MIDYHPNDVRYDRSEEYAPEELLGDDLVKIVRDINPKGHYMMPAVEAGILIEDDVRFERAWHAAFAQMGSYSVGCQTLSEVYGISTVEARERRDSINKTWQDWNQKQIDLLDAAAKN